MCGYNRANQTYLCENRRLMNDVLKEELDFQVSDRVFFIVHWWGLFIVGIRDSCYQTGQLLSRCTIALWMVPIWTCQVRYFSFITAFLYPNHVLIRLGFFACKRRLHDFVNGACLLEFVQMETLMNLTLPKLTTLIGVKRLATPFVMVPSPKTDLMIWSA